MASAARLHHCACLTLDPPNLSPRPGTVVSSRSNPRTRNRRVFTHAPAINKQRLRQRLQREVHGQRLCQLAATGGTNAISIKTVVQQHRHCRQNMSASTREMSVAHDGHFEARHHMHNKPHTVSRYGTAASVDTTLSTHYRCCLRLVHDRCLMHHPQHSGSSSAKLRKSGTSPHKHLLQLQQRSILAQRRRQHAATCFANAVPTQTERQGTISVDEKRLHRLMLHNSHASCALQAIAHIRPTAATKSRRYCQHAHSTYRTSQYRCCPTHSQATCHSRRAFTHSKCCSAGCTVNALASLSHPKAEISLRHRLSTDSASSM